MPLKRLNGPSQLTNATVTRYTTPAATRTILRHMHISNPSGAAVDLTMSIGADAAAVRLFDGFPIPADSVYDWYGLVVLASGDIIAAHASTTLVLTMTLFGEEELT